MNGESGRGVPLWAFLLDAANGDPLRAQELEANLEPEWWEYFLIYRRAKGTK